MPDDLNCIMALQMITVSGLVNKSNGLGFHSHSLLSCVDVLAKLLIPCCLCLPNSDGYLVDEKSNCVAHAICIWVSAYLFGI